MSWIFPLLIFVVLLACVAMCYAEGMWSNAVRLVNVVTAALLATNFYEPIAQWLDHWDKTYSYLWDFLVLWGLFAVFLTILRELTDRISHVKVRFLKLIDRIGSGAFSVGIGWVMVCFTMMTLHTAPMSRTFLYDGFNPETKMICGTAPDRQWLLFMHQVSKGAFCRMTTPQESEKYVFDPKGDFLQKYATRRTQLQDGVKASNSLLVK